MAADKLFRKPSLDVIQGDTLGPMYGEIGSNATAAQMVPGRAVGFDTSDNCVKEATDPSGCIGILGYEKSPLAFKPATRDTAYAVGDHVAVHNTPGMRFRGWLATGLTVNPSTKVEVTANGTFTTTAADAMFNAICLETVTSSGVTACWMQWIG